MKKKQLKIAKMIRCGELNPETRDETHIINQCNKLLDTACSWDIIGPVLFKATNGKYYVVEIEACICEARPEYVKEVLQEIKDNEI